jgi:hypothetical protein
LSSCAVFCVSLLSCLLSFMSDGQSVSFHAERHFLFGRRDNLKDSSQLKLRRCACVCIKKICL